MCFSLSHLPRPLPGILTLTLILPSISTVPNRLSYRNGVTTALTSPSSTGFLSGLGVSFSLGTPHKLAKGAVVQDVTALHVAIDHQSVKPSVSTEVKVLRKLLMDGEGWWGRVAKVCFDTLDADVRGMLF